MRRVGGMLLIVFGLMMLGTGILGLIPPPGKQPSPARISISLLTALGGIGLLYGRYRLTKSRAAKATGRDGDYVHNVPVEYEADGAPYTVLYQPPVKGKNGKPSSLTVSAPAATPSTMQFKRETAFDRLGKSLGIAVEHQTQDFEFDDAVYIRTPSENYAERYLADPSRRAAITDLLGLGFTEVRLTGENVEAVWQSFDPAKNDRPSLTYQAALDLFDMANDVPAEDPDEAFLRTTDMRSVWHVLLWLVAGAFAASAIIGFAFPPLRETALFLPALLAFLFVYPVFGFFAALLLGGTSTSHDRWGRLMGICVALIGVGCVGDVAVLNGVGDTGQPTEHLVTVANKRISRGRRSTTHYAVIPSWDRPGDMLDIRVSSAEYERVIPGRTKVKVTTCPGRLGIEWIKSKEVLLQ